MCRLFDSANGRSPDLTDKVLNLVDRVLDLFDSEDDDKQRPKPPRRPKGEKYREERRDRVKAFAVVTFTLGVGTIVVLCFV